MQTKGFTLIELLIVAAIIGILLALAIPNLLKARISSNEANAKKMLQTLRDAEGEYFEQDLNTDGSKNYTDAIGPEAQGTPHTLRDPSATSVTTDALVDSSFVGADINGGAPGGDGGVADACASPKSGYCITHHTTGASANAVGTNGFDDFGWQASMTNFNKTGRRNYAVYSDGSIRCQIMGLGADGNGTAPGSGTVGDFDVDRAFPGCAE